MKKLRVATICHNDDDQNDKNHRRVRLELVHEDGGYVWQTSDGEDTATGVFRTIKDAMHAASQAWGSDVWGLKFGSR